MEINIKFVICNCNNVIEIMNNMYIVTAPLTDDNYSDMEINETCKIFFSDDFFKYPLHSSQYSPYLFLFLLLIFSFFISLYLSISEFH